MKRLALVLLLGAVLAVPARAQDVSPLWTSRALSPAETKMRDVLVGFRDTLMNVNAAIAQLQRDFRLTSTASLVTRARMLSSRCGDALHAAPAARSAVESAAATTRAKRTIRARMLKDLDALAPVLAKCQTEFAALAEPARGEEVRGYGNARAEPVRAAVLDYTTLIRGFFKVMDVDVRPRAAPPPPVSN